jgi:hypothetical protein
VALSNERFRIDLSGRIRKQHEQQDDEDFLPNHLALAGLNRAAASGPENARRLFFKAY